MCGQWSEEGYMHKTPAGIEPAALSDWTRIVDEAAEHGIRVIILRGGETFLYPHIAELMHYINGKGIYIAVDTNGTRLAPFIDDIIKIRQIHLTISMDGPEEIHDQIRGVRGTYSKIRENLVLLENAEKAAGVTISRSLNFTISGYNYYSLGQMPDTARALNMGVLCKVPYYYVPDALGRKYESEMEEVGCEARTWHGFHHEESGVDVPVLMDQLKTYRENLKGIKDVPYMPLTDAEYADWFSDPVKPVRSTECRNAEELADIQPDGSVNSCVDFPDCTFGNIKEASLSRIWNGDRARAFRERRRRSPFSVCHRCGAKYMSVFKGD
jgi:radical SAM protein with 4Fe4S-binding SPASM domain